MKHRLLQAEEKSSDPRLQHLDDALQPYLLSTYSRALLRMDFQLVGVLGRDGLGRTLLMRGAPKQYRHKLAVAKLFTACPSQVAAVRLATTLAHLGGLHCVPRLYACVPDCGLVCLEYLPGTTLRQVTHLVRRGLLHFTDLALLGLLHRLGDGLLQVHARGFAHPYLSADRIVLRLPRIDVVPQHNSVPRSRICQLIWRVPNCKFLSWDDARPLTKQAQNLDIKLFGQHMSRLMPFLVQQEPDLEYLGLLCGSRSFRRRAANSATAVLSRTPDPPPLREVLGALEEAIRRRMDGGKVLY